MFEWKQRALIAEARLADAERDREELKAQLAEVSTLWRDQVIPLIERMIDTWRDR